MKKSLKKHISDYLGDSIFTPSDAYDLEIGHIQLHIETAEYDGEPWSKEKALVSMKKGDMSYEFTAIDRHDWENAFWPVTVNASTYLCFRKTLYGFTLLNTETFEDYDFFPEKVLDGKESYIVVSAVPFGDYIVFDGCYWGAPYVFYIYDHPNRRFLDLYDALGVYSAGDIPSAKAHENALTLKCENQARTPVTLNLSCGELEYLLNEKGKSLVNEF